LHELRGFGWVTLKIKVAGRSKPGLSEGARYICPLYGVAMSGINWKKS
jgi:hypothetical protein